MSHIQDRGLEHERRWQARYRTVTGVRSRRRSAGKSTPNVGSTK